MGLQDTGVNEEALRRFIEEQIYTLPGVDSPQDAFTVVLTGSRSAGIYTPKSDVDIDVLCPQPVYESVHRAALGARIIQGRDSFLWVLREDNWGRYFGRELGRPHFSLISLDRVEEQFGAYDDVGIWIWTNARVIVDPDGQFQRIRDSFEGYAPDVLVDKIKYRWLLAGYWDVDVYPYHHARDDEMVAALAAIVNSVNELLRFFFLVEGKAFPYTEKLMRAAASTKLGKRFVPLLQQVAELVVGRAGADVPAWERLDRAHELLCCYDKSEECRRLDDACAAAMIEAGLDSQWVKADYENIHELLSGKLGPVP